jgi:hypothetical protein
MKQNYRLNFENGGMGGKVGSTPAYYGSTLGSNSNPDIPQKSYMGHISKGLANALKLAPKNIRKIEEVFTVYVPFVYAQITPFVSKRRHGYLHAFSPSLSLISFFTAGDG